MRAAVPPEADREHTERHQHAAGGEHDQLDQPHPGPHGPARRIGRRKITRRARRRGASGAWSTALGADVVVVIASSPFEVRHASFQPELAHSAAAEQQAAGRKHRPANGGGQQQCADNEDFGHRGQAGQAQRRIRRPPPPGVGRLRAAGFPVTRDDDQSRYRAARRQWYRRSCPVPTTPATTGSATATVVRRRRGDGFDMSPRLSTIFGASSISGASCVAAVVPSRLMRCSSGPLRACLSEAGVDRHAEPGQ